MFKGFLEGIKGVVKALGKKGLIAGGCLLLGGMGGAAVTGYFIGKDSAEKKHDIDDAVDEALCTIDEMNAIPDEE